MLDFINAGLVLLFVLLIFFTSSIISKKRKEQIEQVKKESLQQEMARLERERNELCAELRRLEEVKAQAKQKLSEEQARLVAKQEEEEKNCQLKLKEKQDAYFASLEEFISEQEARKSCELSRIKVDFDREKKALTEDFLTYSAKMNEQREVLSAEIAEMEKHIEILVERTRKQQEYEQNLDYYHIQLDESSKHDINKLKEFAFEFSKPNTIYKLIWDNYYKTPVEALFRKILGANLNKGGIYKITNIENEKVYIGKATDFQKRWRQHAKQGCGIDRTNQLLYEDMMKFGLEKFTFEVLEQCDNQTEREKYWIKQYKSNEIGYNLKVG